MDSIALQLTKDIGSNSELNSQLVKELNERVEMIVDSVGGNSSMFKQLALSQDMCGILIVNLESVAPKLGHLTASIGKLGEKETELVQQLDEVADRVSEAKALEKAPLDSATQPANDQLQLQLEEASAQLSIVQASLEAKEMENETRRHELAEATAQTQTAENRAAQLEFEVASLQKNVQAIELKVREELNRASVVSRDHMRAKFEQQLHNAMKEKLELEKDSERMKKQLACIQQSLVRAMVSILAVAKRRRLNQELHTKSIRMKSIRW